MGHIGSRIARSCQVLATAVVGLAALFTVGCDECDHYGQTRCDGSMVQECIDDGDVFIHFYWTNRFSCPVICHEAGGGARCVGSREPVPECAGDPNGAMCLAGVPSRCWDGYLSQGQACAATTQCVVSAACGAMCAREANPEPRCPTAADPGIEPTTYFCDSEIFVSCACGYVTDRHACGKGSCQVVGGQPRCQ